ncbi:MAG TPA: SPOR domain-containing protein [Novosphingobium sp.]|nr:SPOR domain-containing protein [Novosphingobium sp.]
MGKKLLSITLLAGATALPAGPALADVRAGVEAWSRNQDEVAVREWQGPAARGDADAQFNMGQAYKLGRGVKQDLVKAEELFAKAAAQGHPQASDNYGLLLFRRGQRAQALPYLRAGADRGNPNAQYLLGIAHFNGEGVPKDWVRAYALVYLSRQGGVEAGPAALDQMNQYIPIEQRQQAVALASELAAQADATRAREFAAVDLGNTVPSVADTPSVAMRTQRQPVIAARSPSTVDTADAVANAVRVAGNDSPRTAGADFARPQVAAAAPPPVVVRTAPPPITVVQRPPSAAIPPPPRPAAQAATGTWRVQLGAFGVAGNADALWNRVKARPELAGHAQLLVRAGAVTKLQVGGFASRGAAQAACTRLTAAGFACVPAQR